jgi:nicotinamide mononucleotide adenylyltransferase
MFDWKKPTVQMLGRWQPWHTGHTELFKKAHALTGQVAIMIRDVPDDGTDAGGGRTNLQTDNPFNVHQVKQNISQALWDEGLMENKDFVIINVPNIVDISYGRGVGYTFTEHDLGEEIHGISATKIRKEMREKGEL